MDIIALNLERRLALDDHDRLLPIIAMYDHNCEPTEDPGQARDVVVKTPDGFLPVACSDFRGHKLH